MLNLYYINDGQLPKSMHYCELADVGLLRLYLEYPGMICRPCILNSYLQDAWFWGFPHLCQTVGFHPGVSSSCISKACSNLCVVVDQWAWSTKWPYHNGHRSHMSCSMLEWYPSCLCIVPVAVENLWFQWPDHDHHLRCSWPSGWWGCCTTIASHHATG